MGACNASGGRCRGPALAVMVILGIGFTCATGVAMAQEAVAQQTADSHDFDIPPGPLAGALNRFAETAGLALTFDPDLAAGRSTAGLTGDYTVRRGLRRLLEGTGLRARFSSAGAVTVVSSAADRLAPIAVEARAATGAAESVVADLATTGTKTATAIEDVPQSISVVTRERLDRFGADTISEAFRYVPGVQGEATGNDTRVDFLRFRGFNDDGNAVFRDGLQLRSTGFGQFFPEMYGVQRVEVARGPASSLFGLANPGGVVNLVTKRPPREAFGEVALEYGSFDHGEARVDVGGPLGEGDAFSARLTGLVRNSSTQVDFVDDDRRFVAPAFTWRPGDDTTLTVLLQYQEDDTGSTNQFLPAQGTVQPNPNGEIDTNTFTGEPAFDDFDRETYSLAYLLEHRIDDTWTFRQNARFNRLDVDSEQIFGGGLQADLRTLNRFSFTADAETDGITLDTQAEADLGAGLVRHRLLIGLDYQDHDFEETQGFGVADPIDIFNPVYGAPIPNTPTFLDTRTEQEQLGLYVQDQVTIAEDWVVTLGGRQDEVDTRTTDRLADSVTDSSDSEFSGRAGLVRHTAIGLSPYIGYAESFLPTSGTDVAGNAFEPTTGEQTEIGLRYSPPGRNIRVTLAAFDLVRENVTTTDPANPNFNVQTGEIESRGVEVELAAELDSGVRLVGAYTNQDVEITESNDGDEGNQPAVVPDERASLWADYTLRSGPLEGLGFGLGVRYKGETFGDNANSFEVDGETLWDASVDYRWRDLHFGLDATNLFDEEYIESCTSAGACFFGARRDVKATVTYKW